MNPVKVAQLIMEKLLLDPESEVVLPVVAVAHTSDTLKVVQELVKLEVADKFLSGYSSDLDVPSGYSDRCHDFTSLCVTDEPSSIDYIKRLFNPNYVITVNGDDSIHVIHARASFPHCTVPSHTLRKKFLYLPERKLVYCVMNKCGSTYIGRGLTGLDTDDAIQARSSSLYHMQDIFSRTNDLYKFTVVRNPYSRFVSTYLDIIAGPEGVPSPRNIYYRRALKLPVDRRIEFTELIDAVEKQGFIWGPGHEHWLPQTTIACIGIIKYDDVGRLEDLNNFLETKVVPVLRANGDTRQNIFSGEHCRKSGASDSWTQFYTDDGIRNRVYSLYEIDFDVLRYSKWII